MTKLFDAAKNNAVDAAKKLVCKADIDGSEIPDSKSGLLGFEVHGTSERNGVTTVDVTITTKSGSSTAPPAGREGGRSWKVCFSALKDPTPPTGGSARGVPTEPPTLPTNAGPATGGSTSTGSTDPTSECASNTTSLTAAYSYGARRPGSDPGSRRMRLQAQRVPAASVTASLKGKNYEPEAVDTNAPVQRFTAKDGSTLAVTTAKESDGKYYVIAVVKV